MNKLLRRQEFIDRWIKKSSGKISQKDGEKIYDGITPKHIKDRNDDIRSKSLLKKIHSFTKDIKPKIDKPNIAKEAVKKIKEKPKSLGDSLKIGASSQYKPKTIPNGTHLNITV